MSRDDSQDTGGKLEMYGRSCSAAGNTPASIAWVPDLIVEGKESMFPSLWTNPLLLLWKLATWRLPQLASASPICSESSWRILCLCFSPSRLRPVHGRKSDGEYKVSQKWKFRETPDKEVRGPMCPPPHHTHTPPLSTLTKNLQHLSYPFLLWGYDKKIWVLISNFSLHLSEA